MYFCVFWVSLYYNLCLLKNEKKKKKKMKKRKEKKGNKGCAKISIDVNPQVYESQYISLSNDHN